MCVFLVLCALLPLIAYASETGYTDQIERETSQPPVATVALPLSFEPNLGQTGLAWTTWHALTATLVNRDIHNN